MKTLDVPLHIRKLQLHFTHGFFHRDILKCIWFQNFPLLASWELGCVVGWTNLDFNWILPQVMSMYAENVCICKEWGEDCGKSPGPQIVDHKVNLMVEELRHYQVSLARIPLDEVVHYIHMAFRWVCATSPLMTSSKKWQKHCKKWGTPICTWWEGYSSMEGSWRGMGSNQFSTCYSMHPQPKARPPWSKAEVHRNARYSG